MALACFGDPGLVELRRQAAVPVTGRCEAAMLAAAQGTAPAAASRSPCRRWPPCRTRMPARRAPHCRTPARRRGRVMSGPWCAARRRCGTRWPPRSPNAWRSTARRLPSSAAARWTRRRAPWPGAAACRWSSRSAPPPTWSRPAADAARPRRPSHSPCQPSLPSPQP
ncbi:hypothetical protein [Pseudorhodoferax sp.]|uniref:hypothetical protein n=1 Tax=Pseudorhodoferax sp. TaxID=1993553 RepID=UPI0039E5B394